MFRDADTALPAIPSEERALERIGRAKLAYRAGGLKPPVLPNDLSEAVATKRVGTSPLKDKKVTVAGVPGVQLTELERAALTWLAAAFCQQTWTGTQWRSVLPLAPGVNAPVGQVIMGFAANLDATVTLVGRGLPLGGPDEKVADEALVKELTQPPCLLAAVKGTWRPGELLKVSRALALLNANEAAALNGVVLERVTALQDAKPGHTVARFTSTFAPEIGEMGVIRVADMMFDDDVLGFHGGANGIPVRPPSFQSLLHEVGHAVDTARRRALARQNAEFVLSRGGVKQQYAIGQPIPDDLITKTKGLAFTNINAEQTTEKLAVAAYNAVVDEKADAAEKIAGLKGQGGAMAVLAERLADVQAGKSEEPALAQIEVLRKEQRSVVEIYALIAKLIKSLNSENPQAVLPSNFDTIRQALSGLDHAPWADFHREVMRWCDVQQRAAEWRREYMPKGRETTGRRTAFVAYVKERDIPADLTRYAESCWPDDPDEFLCEAFGLWKVDPDGLGGHSTDLVAYFKGDGHLNGT